ncbi:MAG: SAM-dependent methyltransferase [Jiangellaceae bacterium]
MCEIGCGEGVAAVQIARAFPGVTVDGYDLDEKSIAAARTEADAVGVADRVRFEVCDAAADAVDGDYDLVFCVEMLHDVSDPVGVLGTMRRLRAPGGAVLVIDERAADAFDPDADEMERLFYACSTLHCLPVGMTEPGSAATGTVIRPDVVRQYAQQAGFDGVDVLDIDHPQFRLYLLHSLDDAS